MEPIPPPGGTWSGEGHADLRRGGFAYAVLAVAVATLVGYVWTVVLKHSNLTLILILGVLSAGYRFGMRPALFAAMLAFLSYNFFFEEPRFTLSINAEDLLPFCVFFTGALIVGALTGRLSDRARQTQHALADVSSLFAASRELSAPLEPERAALCLVQHLEATGCLAAVWLDTPQGCSLAAASPGVPLDLADAQRAAVTAEREADGLDRRYLRMHSGGRRIGAVALWRGVAAGLPDGRWMRALVDLAAVAIDRARIVAEIAETRVVAEKEGLRTALLSSLSHDLRTPLATILASVTSLQEYDQVFDAATRRDLLDSIQEETERLNRYVANLLEMTRLESGALHAGRALIDAREALAAALQTMERRLRGRPVLREFGAAGKHVDVNPVLLEQALINIIENAVQHSPPDAPLRVRVDDCGSQVRLSVEDEGAGIAAVDVEHVFEKFFRGGGDRRGGSGVGLGLSVTRGLIESFGGRVRAVSPARDGRGTRIDVDLPAHRAMEAPE